MKNGKTQVYTGEGKGKTTAALGSVIRAAGWGMKIAVFQFLKGRETGEERFLRENIDNCLYKKVNVCEKFYFEMSENEKEKMKSEINEEIKKIDRIAKDGGYDLIVLDEIICCGDMGVTDKRNIENLIQNKNENTEIILTGRGAWPELIDIADTVTEMKKVRHIFDSGIDAKRGSEY